MILAILLCLLAAAVGLSGWAATCRQLRTARAELSAARQRHRLADALLRELSNSLVLVDHSGQCLVTDEMPTWFGDELREELRARVQQAVGDGLRRTLRFTHRQRSYTADVLPLHTYEPGAAAVLVRESLDADSADHKLQRLAARNDAILRSAMDGFFIVDQEYRFLEVNAAFCRMTGYSEQELMRLKITDLELRESDDGGPVMPLRTGLHQLAAAHRHRDGHTVYLEISVFVLHDDGRKLLVGFARDVTQRKRELEVLERLHRSNKLLLDSVAEGICGIDPAGHVTFVNPSAARLLGWSAEELLGRDLHTALYGPDDRARCADGRCAACTVQPGAPDRVWIEDEFRTREGATIPVQFSRTPMLEAGQIVGAVLVFQDISQRRRAEAERERLEAQMRQAQKLESLGLLAGGIAHDFNNVLVGILGNAFLAIEQLPPDSPVHGRLQRIISASQRASKLIQQIRAYSGRLTREVSEVDVNDLIEETIELVRTGIPKPVRILTDLQPDLHSLLADSGQLQQIVMNLLINAAEAIGDRPGMITVRTRQTRLTCGTIERDYAGQQLSPGDYVILEVSDDGCGMDAETLSRVFDPFYSSKQLGRGLGLAAVRGFVQAHQGGIRIDSAVGRGSTLTVALPRISPRPAAPPAVAGGAGLPGRGTVLVIDDEPDIRDVVQAVLQNRGIDVLTASDGAEGLRLLRERSADVDVVLLDMNMPGMSGIDTFREITRIGSRARVILSSGYGQREAIPGMDAAPSTSFLQKPYTMDELVRRIGAALSQDSTDSQVQPAGCAKDG